MKLDAVENNITRTGEFKEQKFGIGNMAVILDILRTKIYSNAVSALTREIMSNARDAHREIGKPEVPIEVKLPNDLDPTFYVRDFGPGITPDRMANIFILYGMSSKRDDNTQTGGFGLGAKTPFAYTDTFNVTSITPEQEFIDNDGETRYNVMVKREYVAYIDESKIGSMSLVFSKVTDEPQGTKISLVAQKQDFANFKQWVRHAALYWQVVEGEPLPVVKGIADWEWNMPKRETEGENWFLEMKLDSYSYGKKDVSAIIDGIQYPINVTHLNIDYGSQEESVINYALRLVFDVGEISITANREEIDYSKKTTIDIIKSRLRLVVADIQDKLSKKIENVPTYWEAKVLWNTYSQEYRNVIKTVFWHGIEIDTENIPLRKHNCTAFLFSMRNDGYITRRETAIIEFLKDTKICIEDTGLKHPSKGRVQTLFNNTPGLSRVYVVKFPEDQQKKDTCVAELDKEHNFNKIEQTNLSTLPRTTIKAINKNGSPRGTMTRVFSFTPSHYKSESWTETDLDIEEDSGIYVEIKNRQAIIGTRSFSISSLENLVQSLEIKNADIFGIPTRFLKKVGQDWQKLEDVIKEKIDDIEKDPLVSNHVDDNSGLYTYQNKFAYLSNIINGPVFANGIVDKNSDMLQYVKLSKEYDNVKKKVKQLNSIKSYYVHPTIQGHPTKNVNANDLRKLYDIVVDKYPLMLGLNTWVAANRPVKDFIEYINLIDAK